MKRYSYILSAAILAAITLSCRQEEMEGDLLVMKGQVFHASAEGALTKTTLAGNDTDGYQVLWQSGDEIIMTDAQGTTGTFVTSDSDTPKADFTLTTGYEASQAPFRAWYPASLYNDGTPTLPARQNYTEGSFTGLPMFAESSSENLLFKNIGGLIRLNLSTSLENVAVSSIVLSADQGLSGPITNAASLSSDDYKATVAAGGTVVLDCGAGVTLSSAATPFYISVPEGGYTGLSISAVTVTGNRQTWNLKNERTVTVGRSSITDISLSFTENVEYTDLSAKGTANTYIVSEAGAYKFKATVKGNGGLDPVTGTTATELQKSDISGVTVLWELAAQGNAIGCADGIYDIGYFDGYVYFSTPDTFAAGSAYAAVYKDGEGGAAGAYDKGIDEILWSWLIWATPAPGDVDYNGNVFMDRNLGAVTGTGYEGGFAYQWGRPAPFSAAYSKSYTPYTYYPSRTTVFDFPKYPSGTTVANATAHPTSFFQPPSGNWMSEAEFHANLWSDSEKTIYDPCPVGWKVPSKEQLSGITSALTFYGSGFIGTCNTDFGYGNPSSVLLWSSSCDSYSTVWANAYGSITSTQVDVYFRSGMNIRPVEDTTAGKNLEDYTDLSAGGSANSYIVPAAGDYMFRATVKGNGSASLAGVNASTSESSISTAALVWASYGTATAPVESEMIRRIGYQDGYVYFSTGTTFREGNAVVAVKDASGTILWSWHLWFTDDPVNGQTYPGGAIFMDRDLGALSAGESPSNYGLLYQWGRKDPFLNSKITNSGDFTDQTVWTPAVLGTVRMAQSYSEGSLPPVADLVATPTKYTYVTGGNWTSSLTAAGGDLWAAEKTIFDPCPPGWKVPQMDMWDKTFRDTFVSLDFADPLIASTQSGTYSFPNGGLISPYPLMYVYRGANNAYNTAYIIRSAGNLVKPSEYHYRYWASDGAMLKDRWSILGYQTLQGFYAYSELYNKTAATIVVQDSYNNVSYPDLALAHAAPLRCVREECVVVEPASVSLPATATVGLMDSMTLTAATTPSECSYYTTTWTSSNPSVAIVSDNGSVFGLSNGTCTITVTTSNGKSASCQVTVGGAAARKAVDMGLPSGTKWANMNLGANSPAEPGSYYAWGEATPRTAFGSGVGYSRPATDQNAAGTAWGSPWRTPSMADVQELMDNCTWTAISAGYLAVSKNNGNAIFFPAGGHYQSSSLLDSGTAGYYWTSDYQAGNYNSYGSYLWLYLDFNEPRTATSNFYFGMNIRAVQ